jgi:iron-sulfur cluster assembly protein
METQTMFTVTPVAAQELLAAAVRSNAQGLALRVAARQVADGSIEYGMGFDDTREDDEPTRFGDLTVLVGSPSKPLLQDTVLDYVEIEPGRFDFIFAPPDAQAAARGGCGSGGCAGCGA